MSKKDDDLCFLCHDRPARYTVRLGDELDPPRRVCQDCYEPDD